MVKLFIVLTDGAIKEHNIDPTKFKEGPAGVYVEEGALITFYSWHSITKYILEKGGQPLGDTPPTV